MLARIINRLTDEQISEGIDNLQEAQDTMSILEKQRLEAYSKQLNHEASESDQESRYLKDKREMLELKEIVPSLENFLSQVPENSADHKRFSHILYQKNRTLDRLEERLESTTFYDFLEDLIQYGVQEERVALYDAFAERIGKWFERGAVGEGSITYNEKTYTFPAG